jgi:hypothetical protein
LRNEGALRHTIYFAIGWALTFPLNALPHADRIIVHKKDRTHGADACRTGGQDLQDCLGTQSARAKAAGRDFRTPEGEYVIDRRNAKSQCHRSLHISYPNATDRERARKLGVSPGGDISIHGILNGYGYLGAAHRQHDWTYGCIAVTDQEIEEIWKLVDNGTPIEILP